MAETDTQSRRVLLALRLGWAFAEVGGRLKEANLQWQDDSKAAQRLFISHPMPTSGESLAVFLKHLLALWALLFPHDEKSPPPCEPPQYLRELVKQMEHWSSKASKPSLDAKKAFEALNEWSRACWIHLETESPVLRDAASLGASLGDTFCMFQRTLDGQPPVNEASWRYLLSAGRIYHLIEDVRRVEPYLPQDTGALLRHSLWEWGIANDLGRTKAGKLRIAHPWDWARLKKHHSDAIQELCPDEEKQLKKNLGAQHRLWGDLLAGRLPALRPRDLRLVRFVSGALFVPIAGLLGGLTVGGVVMVLALAYHLAVWLFTLLAPLAEIKDWLAIGGAAAAVLGFFGPLLWRWSRWVLGLYDRIEHQVRLARLKQKTLHRWDGKNKPLGLIIWQQFWHPDTC